MLLHRTISTERYFYPEMRLHRDAFTHTETLLHTNTFAHIFFNTEQLNAHIAYPKTNRGAFTKDRVDTRSFYLRTFLHRHTFT